LKGAFRQSRPFIRPEDAHLSIGFSCVAYLNTGLRLLPQHSGDEERMLQVLQGLHGLQIYANKYWHKHILAYMDLAVSQTLEVPQHLVLQLEEVLKYSKFKESENSIGSARTSNSKDNTTASLPSLERFPRLSSLVSGLERFRTGLKNQDWTQKSFEGKFCSLDNRENRF
jgi:hypothetical protein